MPGSPEYWRTVGQRMRMEGSNCPFCGIKHFPPRAICPDCGEKHPDIGFSKKRETVLFNKEKNEKKQS